MIKWLLEKTFPFDMQENYTFIIIVNAFIILPLSLCYIHKVSPYVTHRHAVR